MRYGGLLLIALVGACKIDWAAGLTEHSSGFTPTYIRFIAVTVSPTVVHAGSRFAASATITDSNCVEAEIEAVYARQAAGGVLNSPAMSDSFVAVLGQTAVHFTARCSLSVGVVAARADSNVVVAVLPAS